jgi:hypothetical protein
MVCSGVWVREERVAPRFSVYTLPLTREQIFWPRIRAVIWCSLATATCVSIGLMAIGVHMYIKDPVKNPLEDIPVEAFFLLYGALLSLGQLSAMFRLFYGNRLIAAVFACMVLFPWFFIGGQAWVLFAQTEGYASPPRPGSLPMSWSLVTYTLWIIAVITGLPLLVSYLGFCRTKLLETSERTRGVVSLVVFLLLIVWGSFLVLTVPTQLFTMMFVR